MHRTWLVPDDGIHRKYPFEHSTGHVLEIEKYEADFDPHAVFVAAHTTPKDARA